MISCQIEKPDYKELLNYMRMQIEDAFPLLRGEERIKAFTDKLYAHAEFCFCRENGKLVGMIAYYANGKGADFAYLAQAYVSPDYRKKGLFFRMLNVVEEDARIKGFQQICLEVDYQNEIAQRCYSHHGFRVMQTDNQNSHSFFMNKTF